MKITAFNPMILTPKADEAIEVFEALGFERRHMKTGVGEENVTAVDMKDANGFRVSIVQVDSLPRDMMTIRMNVDNLEEAVEFLSARGFKDYTRDRNVTDSGSSRATMMVSPSGFSISISQHIK